MRVTRKKLEGLLHDFGYESFRPGQERIIRQVLAGRDVLGVFPTAWGKSLTYQLASQLLPGPTVVVSPLIALMQDQVESLEERDVGVSAVNSTKTRSQAEHEMDEVRDSDNKLLYVTPERFENEQFMEEMEDVEVSLFVVDEAHCISEWGHDFRPAYLRLATAADHLGRPPILALTATATPWVRNDIIERLEMRDPEVVVRGFDRSNLFFDVRRVVEEREDRRELRDLFEGNLERYPEPLNEQIAGALQGSGIIYTTTTKAAQETAGWLQRWGVSADYYHGQRKKADRERVQDAFMNDEIQVITATNAFGLGVDKPDVRFVIHRDIPPNIEAYYQEAGRSGRDGEFAFCCLIYRSQDLGRATFLAGTGELTRSEIEQTHDAIIDNPSATLEELREATGIGKSDLVRLLTILREDGIVEEDDEGRIHLLVDDFDPGAISLEQEESRKAHEQSRFQMMRRYAETRECRRRFILNYFGEEYDAQRCGLCDNDIALSDEDREQEEDAASRSPFAMGDRVVHKTLGPGAVQHLSGDTVTVLFDQSGYRELAIDLVLDEGLLEPGGE